MRRLTRMPTAWPNGQVFLQVLDGSVDQQVYSIWKYLEDGDKACCPASGREPDSRLYVFDEAVMYRDFIQGSGPRAIGLVIRNDECQPLMLIRWGSPCSGMVYGCGATLDRSWSGFPTSVR